MTSPIIDFIEARLAEDEATAMAAEGANWGQRRDRMNPYVIHDVDAYKPGILYTGRIIAAEKLETRDHIVRHDPARVLREVAAKRAILAVHKTTVKKQDRLPFDPYTGEPAGDRYEVECEICGWVDTDPATACLTLRHLAAAWPEHPDFDPNWSTT